MITTILLAIVIAIMFLSVIFIIIDSNKKRKLTRYPFISFIIPSYNNSKVINDTIEGIYSSYDHKFEVIIIDDGSKDESIGLLKELKQKYRFTLIQNKKNQGKASSINKAFKITKGEIIFIVDSDTIINKNALNDVLKRFEYDKNVGAVSCRYKTKKSSGFFEKMQDIEYNFMAFILASSNIYSTISLWGGCMAFRRKAFEDIDGLSRRFLTEDVEAALKLKENDWKVEQSNYYVFTTVPTNLKQWYNQKIRWSSGGTQCFIRYPGIYLKHPTSILLLLSFTIFSILFIYNLIDKYYFFTLIYENILHLKRIGVSILTGSIYYFALYSSYIVGNMIMLLLFPLFNIVYLLYDPVFRKKPLKLLLLFPYSFIYYPLVSIVSIIGACIGVYNYNRYLKEKRAW
jgi:cellulose synthase/poly-beta-1,6-N-acetylglucosamine synthase-like glycosyltransferase